MKIFYKAVIVALFASFASQGAYAQDTQVTLVSSDQNLIISGELLSYDDDFYFMRTALGELSVDRNLVNCTGETCPPTAEEMAAVEAAAVSEAAASEAPAASTPVKDGEIVLTSGDGTFFGGKLLDFDGVNYVLETTMGVLTIRSEFVQCDGAACPNANASAADEQREVKLTSGDGTFFSGDLLDFDGTNYVLETTMGILTIRSEFVQCEGGACPDTGPVVAEFSVASPAGVGEQFVGEALNRFAREKSLNITRSISFDGTTVNYLVGGQDGSLLADITVVPSNDIASIKALFSGTAAFALTREAFTAEDIAAVTNMAVPDVSALLDEQTIALDALTSHINPANRVRSISIAQIGDILSGRVTNWSEVGGDDAPISLYVLEEASNLARVTQRDILAPRGLRLAANATVHATLPDLNNAVAGDPNGFAVSYRSDSDGTTIPTTRNTCNIFSSANAFSLQTEEYPLTMRWHLYTLKGQEIPSIAVSLAEYLSSDQGQSAAELAGLVGLAIDKQPMSEQGERLLSAMLADTINNAGIKAYQDYLSEVSTADRLSTTLRFITGSSQLDQRAVRDVRRISDLISEGILDGNDIVLVGFSDSVGKFSGNMGLSLSRAEQAKALILSDNIGIIGPEDITTLGFGPVAPVGCNATFEGRHLNRRVEVWIRGTNQGKLQ